MRHMYINGATVETFSQISGEKGVLNVRSAFTVCPESRDMIVGLNGVYLNSQ